MASFKHKVRYSHNKCETAQKFILFLPETIEIKIICIEVQKRLWGVTGTMRLQHWRTGWNDSGLARGMNCFELELWAHPQAPMRPGVSHYFNLWEYGKRSTQNCNLIHWVVLPVHWSPRILLFSSKKSILCHQFREKLNFRTSLLEKGCCSQSQELLEELWRLLNHLL